MPLLKTDRALLDRFRAGDREALTKVYWEYVRKVERLLSARFRIGASELADLVQEVFLCAFSEKSRRAYDGIRDYGPYLCAIARNILLHWSRVRGREIPAPWVELEATMDATPLIGDRPRWADPATMRVVEKYLSTLPPDLSEVHKLRHGEGLSQEQAAQRLGVGSHVIS